MGATAGAVDLVANHPVALVPLIGHVPRRDWLEKAGPAGAGIELRFRRKEGQPTAGAGIDPQLFVVQQRAAKWPFGAAAAENAELLRRQALAPLLFAEHELGHIQRTHQLASAVENVNHDHCSELLL